MVGAGFSLRKNNSQPKGCGCQIKIKNEKYPVAAGFSLRFL
jgi:hypothetical protein